MDKDEILHLAKKIGQFHKSQLWLYSRMEVALDELLMEVIRRDKDYGHNSNTIGDIPGNDGWTNNEMDSSVSATSVVDIDKYKEEKE